MNLHILRTLKMNFKAYFRALLCFLIPELLMRGLHPIAEFSFWTFAAKKRFLQKKFKKSLVFWLKYQLTNANLIISTSAVQVFSGAVVSKFRKDWPEARFWFIEGMTSIMK